MTFKQQTAGGYDVLRLGAIEPYALDVFFQRHGAQREHGLRRIGDPVELARREIHALVRRLRGQYNRDQKLEWRTVFELARRAWIDCPQALENLIAFRWI